MENLKTVTIDGQSYNVDQFSPGLQQAIAIWNSINLDKGKAELEVIKASAALQQIGAQIQEGVKAELAAKEAEPKTAAKKPRAKKSV